MEATLANILTQGQSPDTEVANRFFSNPNLVVLQKGIREGVLRVSGGKVVVGDQDTQSLLIVMHHVMSGEGSSVDSNIERQLREMNSKVLAFCMPNVYNNYVSHMIYMKDIDTLTVPIDRPAFSRSTRDKTLEFKGWF